MNLTMILKFSWRYFRAKKSTNAINIISWVSVVAIMFSTASLIIILSAFNGFESLVKSLYSSFYPELRIGPEKGKTINLTVEQLNQLRGIPGVAAFTLVAEERALLQNGSLQTVVNIKGVDNQYAQVSGLPNNIYRGKFNTGDDQKPGLVMGVGVEQMLGLASDRSIYPVSIYLPKKNISSADPSAALGLAMGYPQGSFAIQTEFDNKYVVTNLDFVKSYTGLGVNEFSGVEIKVDATVNIENVSSAVKSLLGTGYKIENRFEQNRMLYTTIRLEKLAIYGIFSLILIVAAFNMVGALSMLVMEKKKDIQVLKAMGADQGLLQKIFLAEGMLLSFIGMAGGMAIALGLYFLQTRFKLVPLEGATFLIDYYPVKLLMTDFLLVASTVLLIGILASWMPARRAALAVVDLRV
jgi:lipoprotein-releasing system permease protein